MTTDIDIDIDIKPVTEDGDPLVAHIVLSPDERTAASYILEAMISGFPVTAICGKVWVPSRNPEPLPLCDKCKELYGTLREFSPNLPDRPTF